MRVSFSDSAYKENPKSFLVNTFSTIDTWFDKDAEIGKLQTHFLLILIAKGETKYYRTLPYKALNRHMKVPVTIQQCNNSTIV